MAQKPILISGAGLAALLFARSLRRADIPFRIYERDASLKFRGQGYRLRLSTEGLDAIESVLEPASWDKFFDRCGKTGGQGFSAFNAVTGEETERAEALDSRGGKTIGISRGDMRGLFFEECEEYIEWNKNVRGYEETDSGVRLLFGDGSKSEEGSMLVGGEGINSHVAKQLSGGRLKVFDTGARGIHGQAPTTAFKALGEGVFRLVDDTRDDGRLAVITNVRPDDMDNPDVQFGFTMIGPKTIIAAPNDDYTIVGKTAADIAKQLTKNWNPRFKPLFNNIVESESAFWKITCSTPSGVPEWPNSPRVTVIGDAAHSMTPVSSSLQKSSSLHTLTFSLQAGGLGANTAVRDSALLGRLISEAGGWKEGITAEYEKQMRVYASEAVEKSFGMAKNMFKVNIDEMTSNVVQPGELGDNRDSGGR